MHEAGFWQGLYEAGQTGWDLGSATPVFRRLAAEQRFEPGAMIVLGAGRGYDARLFARHGFDVTAVDFAPAAVSELQARNDDEAPVTVVKADIFALDPALFGQFDYVLEYTFYCAIAPQRRPDYADVVQKLLRPEGRFIGLLFPLGETKAGPPFGVNTDAFVASLRQRGFRLLHREIPPDSVRPRLGREELLILQKVADAT